MIILVAAAFIGAVFDFLTYGVLKIIWMMIYVPMYFIAGKMLFHGVTRMGRPELARQAVVAMIAGALAAHLVLVGRRGSAVYTMTSVLGTPIILHSSEWPQTLVVASEPLAQNLAGTPTRDNVPVVMEFITDYGCTRSSRVVDVDGVDVDHDPNASWTWKTDKNIHPSPTSGPGTEDHEFPWCWYKFYRGGR